MQEEERGGTMANEPREADGRSEVERLQARVRKLEGELSEIRERLVQRAEEDREKQALLDNMHIAVLRGKPAGEGEFLYANRALANLLGFETVEELMASGPISAFFDGVARETLLEHVRREGIGQGVEMPMRRRDGKRIWVSWTATARFDEAGEIDWIEGIMEDITDRKAATEALRESNARLLHLVENMPVLLDAFGDSLRLLFWNGECERVTGYRAEEIVGNPRAMELLYPDREYRERMMREWAERGHDFRDWEWELTCKDGSKRTIAWSNVASRAPIPPWSSWAVGVDVTERKRAEAELQQRVGLEDLITTIASGFISLSPDQVEKEMSAALRAVGEFTGSDRSWLSLLEEDRIRPMLSWCAEGVDDRAVEVFRGRSMGDFPWVAERLKRLEPVCVDRLEDLPPEAGATRDIMGDLGVHSFLLVPLCRDHTVIGLMGFDCMEDCRSWSPGVVGLLLLLGEVFAGVLQHKAGEEALRESERKYRILAEGTNDVVYTADMEGTLTYVAPQVARFGRRVEDVVGRSLIEQVIPEDRERVVRDFERAMETGEEFPSEFRVLGSDGEVRWVEDCGRVQRDPQGRVVGLAGVLRDITARKHAEEALRDSEAKYRLLVESAGEAIATMDSDGAYTFINGIGASRLGGRPKDFIGMRMADVFPGEVAKRQAAVVQRVIRTGEGEVHETSTVVQGQPRWYRTSIEPMRGPDGSVTSALIIARDITRRRRADLELRQAHRDLMNARESERRHLARELHDSIGQGLVVMQLALQSAVAKGGGKLHVDQAAGLTAMAENCSGLIREVRGICYGLYPPTLESLGLVSAMQELGRYCEPTMAFDLRCPRTLAERRLAPSLEIALFRIAQEAVNNALRHSNGDRIECRLQRRQGRIRLSITDNGKGFDAEGLVSPGLGLRTMNDRAQAVGGVLDVTSGAEGTTVSVWAPLVELDKTDQP
jgi:PAS domain S-box-containing protein